MSDECYSLLLVIYFFVFDSLHAEKVPNAFTLSSAEFPHKITNYCVLVQVRFASGHIESSRVIER